MRSLDDIHKQIAIDSIVQPPKIPASDEELIKIIEEIDSAQSLLTQGLLREKEYNLLHGRAVRMYEDTADHNSIQYRKYDKSRRENTVWREVSTSGYVKEGGGWSFSDIRQQIVELLELKDVQPPVREFFFKPNSEYDALTTLRTILSSATSTIDIKDDYLFTINEKTKNVKILHTISPYMGTSLGISVRLLGSAKELPSAISDINAFLTQYDGRASIRGVVLGKNKRRESHDRFIIIDNKGVYNIGGSIKDLGQSQTSITEIADQQVRKQFIAQFNEWWDKAAQYSKDEYQL